MTTFQVNKKQALKLKSNYQFRSPYHKSKKMLPFNVLGTVSFNKDFPIEVFTVEYRGFTKTELFTSYKAETIIRDIESGKLINQIKP